MKNIRRFFLVRSLSTFAVFGMLALASPTPSRADEHSHAKTASANNSLILFLTQDDPMIAGHALHFAEHALGDGHPVTIILVGSAAKFALKDAKLPKSPVTGAGLDQKVRDLVAKNVKVILTPFSLSALGVKLDDLTPGIAPACSPDLHAEMFEPATKIMVW